MRAAGERSAARFRQHRQQAARGGHDDLLVAVGHALVERHAGSRGGIHELHVRTVRQVAAPVRRELFGDVLVFEFLFRRRARRADEENGRVRAGLQGDIPVRVRQRLAEEVPADGAVQRNGLHDAEVAAVNRDTLGFLGPTLGVEPPIAEHAFLDPEPLLDRLQPGDQVSVAGVDLLDVGEAAKERTGKEVRCLLEVRNAVVRVSQEVRLIVGEVRIGALGDVDVPVERIKKRQATGDSGHDRHVGPLHVVEEPLEVGELTALGLILHRHKPGHRQTPDGVVEVPPGLFLVQRHASSKGGRQRKRPSDAGMQPCMAWPKSSDGGGSYSPP